MANAYEIGVDRQTLDAYAAFKTVVPSKSEEKQIGREFESTSGYSIYKTVKCSASDGEPSSKNGGLAFMSQSTITKDG